MSNAIFHNSSSLFLQVQYFFQFTIFPNSLFLQIIEGNRSKKGIEQKKVYQLLFITIALIDFLQIKNPDMSVHRSKKRENDCKAETKGVLCLATK